MSNNGLREFYEQFLPSGAAVQSLPLKLPSFKLTPMKSHSLPRQPQSRCIAALAAAAAAANVVLVAGAVVPRRLRNPSAVIENGATSDILGSGIAVAGIDLDGHEAFVLTEKGVRAIRGKVPSHILARHFPEPAPAN